MIYNKISPKAYPRALFLCGTFQSSLKITDNPHCLLALSIHLFLTDKIVELPPKILNPHKIIPINAFLLTLFDHIKHNTHLLLFKRQICQTRVLVTNGHRYFTSIRNNTRLLRRGASISCSSLSKEEPTKKAGPLDVFRNVSGILHCSFSVGVFCAIVYFIKTGGTSL